VNEGKEKGTKENWENTPKTNFWLRPCLGADHLSDMPLVDETNVP